MDLFEWYAEVRQVWPPIQTLVHYLKNIYLYAVEHDLMGKKSEEIDAMEGPFNWRYIPTEYPEDFLCAYADELEKEEQPNLEGMATLKELYTTLKSLRDMNLPVDEKLLNAADNLEEKIIKEEILPAMSKDIEPLLSEIQRDLVLVVEYHPGEPISVSLSRKTNISEIVEAKQLTPNSNRISNPVAGEKTTTVAEPHEPTKHIENPTKGMRVTFLDGTVVWHRLAIQTFVETLQKIGFDRIPAVGILHGDFNLVGKEKRPEMPNRVWQHECDGWYIYSNISNSQKIEDLKKISDYYGLNLKIDEGKPE